MSKKELPDVIAIIKNRNAKTAEIAASAAEQRKSLQNAPDIVECVLGPVDGPYKPALYSPDSNMFMPKFREE